MRQFVLAFLFASAIASTYGQETTKPSTSNWVKYETEGETAIRDKLLTDLFDGYNTESYPENTTIKFGFALINAELEEERNVLKTDVWIRYAWQDDRLRWDKEANGIKVVRVKPSKVWTPDVTLYNSATQGERMNCRDAEVLIYSSGKLLWIPPCHLESYCNLTLNIEPYSEQKCNLKFGSWTFDGHTMGLDFWYGKKYADTQDVFGNFDKYELTTNTAVKNEKKYDCCPEPYYDLTFTLGLTRRDDSIHSTDQCKIFPDRMFDSFKRIKMRKP